MRLRGSVAEGLEEAENIFANYCLNTLYSNTGQSKLNVK